MTKPIDAATENSCAGSSRLPANVKLLGLTSLVNDIASEMIYPLLPDLLRGIMAGTYEQVALAIGVIEGIAEAISSILKLFAGSWSDRTGRPQKLDRLGLYAGRRDPAAVGTGGAAVAGFGLPRGRPVRQGYSQPAPGMPSSPRARRRRRRGWAFGFHRAMDHLGAAIGPVLAALFLWRWPDHLQTLFLLTIIPGIVVVAILIFGLASRRAAASQRSRSYGPWRRLAKISGCTSCRWPCSRWAIRAIFFYCRAAASLACEELLPIMWFVFHVAKSAGNLFVGRLVERLGAAVDRRRLDRLRGRLFRICPGERGVARVDAVHAIRAVLRADRTARKDARRAAGAGRAQGTGVRLVQLCHRRRRHAGQRAVRLPV